MTGQASGAHDRVTTFTGLWNMTGFPAATIPSGFGGRAGLPVGVSVIAPRGGEAMIVRIGIELQELLGVLA